MDGRVLGKGFFVKNDTPSTTTANNSLQRLQYQNSPLGYMQKNVVTESLPALALNEYSEVIGGSGMKTLGALIVSSDGHVTPYGLEVVPENFYFQVTGSNSIAIFSLPFKDCDKLLLTNHANATITVNGTAPFSIQVRLSAR